VKEPKPDGDPTPLPRLLTIAQVSALTGRSRSSLYTDVQLGRLRVTHLGSSVRVMAQDYLDYLAKGREPITPERKA